MPHLTVSQAATKLVQDGALSPKAGKLLSQYDRQIDCAVMKPGTEVDKRMSCFIIDSSGSMEDYQDAVVKGHQFLIAAQRKSSKCRRNALYVAQWLFADTPTKLNSFEQLSPTGNDNVTTLNHAIYKPSGKTALYQTLFQVLQEMSANLAFSYSNGISTTFTIGLITDGKDTEGKVSPSEIKALVEELKANNYLVSSVVIGIEHAKFSREAIEEIKDRLGFDLAAFVGQSEGDIRQAFDTLSQSAAKFD